MVVGVRPDAGDPDLFYSGNPPVFVYMRPARPRDIVPAVPASIDETLKLLADADYLADRSLATVLFLALKMGRPLFLEGEAGVGKTEIAKVLSAMLGRRLIRLQCYEGLDVAAAVYEWNYGAQMIAIRLAEARRRGRPRSRSRTTCSPTSS